MRRLATENNRLVANNREVKNKFFKIQDEKNKQVIISETVQRSLNNQNENLDKLRDEISAEIFNQLGNFENSWREISKFIPICSNVVSTFREYISATFTEYSPHYEGQRPHYVQQASKSPIKLDSNPQVESILKTLTVLKASCSQRRRLSFKLTPRHSLEQKASITDSYFKEYNSRHSNPEGKNSEEDDTEENISSPTSSNASTMGSNDSLTVEQLK